MAITSAIANSFKPELAQALHNFTLGGNVFKVALYTTSATLDGNNTVYVPTNEVAGTGYVAGGNNLTNVTPVLIGSTAVLDFQDTAWLNSSITARGCMIYNSSNGNRTVLVQDFGGAYTTINGTFTLLFPTPDTSNAIIRIA